MKKFVFSAVIHETDEGECTANIPLLPGCYASGNSEEAVLEEVKNKVKNFLTSEYSEDESPPGEITEVIEVKVEGKVLKYTAFFFPMGGDEYKVLFPFLPGCVAKGKTYEEALNQIKKEINIFAAIPSTKELFVQEKIKKIEIEF